MAIRLRKNFKVFYRRRLWKQKIKNYKNFLKKYRSGFYNLKKKKLKLKRKKKYLKRKIISFKWKRRLLKRLYFRGYKKRFFFSYLKMRMESIRLKNYLFKFRWRNKRSRWISKYRRGLKRVYYNFLVNKSGFAIRHYKSSLLFYRSYGLYRFLRHFVKFSRLRAILRKYGKVFRDKKKKKKIILRLSKTHPEKLIFLNIFFQNIVKQGRKKLALRIFFNLFTLLKFKYKSSYLTNYLSSLEKIRPLIYYRVIYIGGKKYRIPVLLSLSKSYLVAIRWLLNNCKQNGKVTLALFNELNNSVKNEGAVIKFRKDYHFASFENKTYIRFLRFLKGGF